MKKVSVFIFFMIISSEIVFSKSIDSSIYINPKDFMYANTKRYTLTGELPYNRTKIRPIEFSAFAGTLTAFLVTQHIIQINTIWKNQTEFRILEDADYAIYADKVGHAYGSYLTSNVIREGLYISGISKKTSDLLAGFLGLSYSTYVEIMDGYGEDWGFSPSDFYMDLTGSAFYYLQTYVPFFQNFTPKFMYFPPKWHGERDREPSDIFIDNYSAHTFFLSANVHNILPESVRDYWPKWLELSVGYAVRNLCSGNQDGKCSYAEPYKPLINGDIKYIIALDYNFSHILGEYGDPWDWLIMNLKYFKLPSPAIEIGKYDTKFYLVYPFPIEIGNIQF